MPYIPAGDGSSSGNEEMSYPIDLLREVAAKILANASLGLDEHTTAWQKTQSYVDANPALRPFMDAVLVQHEQHLRASYQWQLDLASALFAAIDTVEGADNDVAQSFRPQHGFGRVE